MRAMKFGGIKCITETHHTQIPLESWVSSSFGASTNCYCSEVDFCESVVQPQPDWRMTVERRLSTVYSYHIYVQEINSFDILSSIPRGRQSYKNQVFAVP